MIKVGDQVCWSNYHQKRSGEVICIHGDIAWIKTNDGVGYVTAEISVLGETVTAVKADDDERIRKIVREEIKHRESQKHIEEIYQRMKADGERMRKDYEQIVEHNNKKRRWWF